MQTGQDVAIKKVKLANLREVRRKVSELLHLGRSTFSLLHNFVFQPRTYS